jgi:wobble nucleotide-excising tRNase
MIESIRIKKAATYGDAPENLDGLSQFNFIYGANGTGKTTVSRVIADETRFAECQLFWRGGTKLETLVYNRDFIDRNFGQSTELKGIFTLGEKDKTTLDKIVAAKMELDAVIKQIEKYTETLQGIDGNGGKKGELAALETEFEDQCWALKQKHDAKLQGAFTGVRGKRRDFKDRMLTEANANGSTLQPLAELEKRAESVFGETPEKASLISEIAVTNCWRLDQTPSSKRKSLERRMLILPR